MFLCLVARNAVCTRRVRVRVQDREQTSRISAASDRSCQEKDSQACTRSMFGVRGRHVLQLPLQLLSLTPKAPLHVERLLRESSDTWLQRLEKRDTQNEGGMGLGIPCFHSSLCMGVMRARAQYLNTAQDALNHVRSPVMVPFECCCNLAYSQANHSGRYANLNRPKKPQP